LELRNEKRSFYYVRHHAHLEFPRIYYRNEEVGIVLQVSNLTVSYRLAGGAVPAVAGVSFNLAPGEILGLVGESGCGKSTVALALLGLLDGNAAVGGQVALSGRQLPLGRATGEFSWREVRGKMLAYVPQDPLTGLNPVLRVGLQVEEAVRAHRRLKRGEARAEALELLKKVNIPAPERACRSYPHQLSGGQRQRVLLAMALAQRPQVLVADEPTTALDVTTQAQILGEIRRLTSATGSAVLFITHDLGVVAGLAGRVAVMYAGRLVETGPVADVFADPAHPYTRALLASLPRLEQNGRLAPVPGQPPSLFDLPPGCAFHLRCPKAEVRCRLVPPPLLAFTPDRAAACRRFAAAGRDKPAEADDGAWLIKQQPSTNREVVLPA
jgi:oligopeptide/dipeptide ABC transporter ATP-binding protein